MKLSKDEKRILDAAIRLSPDCELCDVKELLRLTDFPLMKIVSVCNTLSDRHLIRWCDPQHTVFALNGAGAAYKEIDHLEKKELWFNRLWSFLIGLAVGVGTGWIISLIASK